MISKELDVLKKKAVIFSAAAVADFYIPWNKLHKHKIQSREIGELKIVLQQTPKMLKPMIKEWCPNAFAISFKLETDKSILENKIKSAMKSYGMHAVIGNLLSSHWKEVFIYTKFNEKIHLQLHENEQYLEPKLIDTIVKLHSKY